MEKTSKVKKIDLLPEFQTFLLDKKMVPEKSVSFYALWASKFFNFTRKKQLPSDEYQENTVIEFMETLKANPNLTEWQFKQASDALRLYYFHYRGLEPHNLSAVSSTDLPPELLFMNPISGPVFR